MKIQVLDHGYVELIEAWGHGKAGDTGADPRESDFEVGIIEAARQSTQKGFLGWDETEQQHGDAKLLKFLYDHQHHTPFEFAGMVIEVQAPIFVFREWHRHRTQSYNEMSARYAPLPNLYYRPPIERCSPPNTGNRQALGILDKQVSAQDAEQWLNDVIGLYDRTEKIYQRGLSMGIPKEVARVVMPVGHYTRMRASANLRNWLGFITLRNHPAAQWEIRQFAQAVSEILANQFPHTMKLWLQEHAE